MKTDKRSLRMKTVFAGGLAALLASSAAFGHMTFLASSEAIWPAGETIEIAMTSALEYPDIQFGLDQGRVAFVSATVGGVAVDGLSYAESETALGIRFTPTSAGLGVLAVSTHPRSGEIPPESIDVYFEEIDADADVQAAFHALPGSPALMRSYSKLTKTIFCVATCEGGEEAVFTPMGQALEFVPVQNEARRFALYQDSETLADHRVTIHTPEGRHFDALTDETGRFTVSAELDGEVLLSAIWIDLPETPDGNYHSDQATMTVRLD